MKYMVEELQFRVKDQELLKPADPDESRVTKRLKTGRYREWDVNTLT